MLLKFLWIISFREAGYALIQGWLQNKISSNIPLHYNCFETFHYGDLKYPEKWWLTACNTYNMGTSNRFC